MDVIEAYCKFEDILSKYFFSTTPRLGDLGSMLGDISTKTHNPEKRDVIISGDISVFDEDWTGAWNRIVGRGNNGTAEEIFEVCKVILDYYQNEVEYDLGDSVDYLYASLGLSDRNTLKAG